LRTLDSCYVKVADARVVNTGITSRESGASRRKDKNVRITLRVTEALGCRVSSASSMPYARGRVGDKNVRWRENEREEKEGGREYSREIKERERGRT